MIHLQTIRKHSTNMPYREALVDGDTSISWQELQKNTENKILFILTKFDHGLPKQACYISPNRIELISWLAAFATLKIPVTGLDYSLPTEALKELLNLVGADLLLLSTSSIENSKYLFELGAPQAAQFDMDSPTIVFTDVVGKPLEVDILEHLSKAKSQPPYRAVGLTSGTSGLPKAAIRTQSFDQRRFEYFTNRYDFDHEEAFLLSMPLYHAAGNGWARMFMNLGATVYFAPINSPSAIANVIIERKITASVMTPALLSQILDSLDAIENSKNECLRWVLVGGKHFPTMQKQRALSKLGPIVYEYYGTTETGVNTIAEPADLEQHPNSVGRPFDGNNIAIFDAGGLCLGQEKIGIVAISSYMNMDGYSDGSSNEIMLDGKRYLLTSETGFIDKEDRLYLLNRSTHQNRHHHLYRLEDAIRDIPCIKDVAILQRSDCESSKVECVIEMSAQSYDLSYLQEKLQLLADKEYLQLARYSVVPRIPYSPSGKVRVSELMALLDSSQAKSELVGNG